MQKLGVRSNVSTPTQTHSLARTLTIVLVGVMVLQALAGLVLPSAYRDADWVVTSWFGNDIITLIIAVPLLIWGSYRALSGAISGLLIWLGVLGYSFYNYGYYLFGAALNAFLPIYLVAWIISAAALLAVLSGVDAQSVALAFRSTLRDRVVAGYFILVGSILTAIWLMMWAGYIFADQTPPIAPELFQVVAAVDITMIVTFMVLGGVMLWQRRAWGYVIIGLAAVQSSLYLSVLLVNTLLQIQRGYQQFPGELPIWLTLIVTTLGFTIYLFWNLKKPVENE